MSRYPWYVEEEPRPSLAPKPRLGIPMDSPWDEEPDRRHGGRCPPRSGCSECYPRCAGCGRSVGRHGDWCNHCEEAAAALPPYDTE